MALSQDEIRRIAKLARLKLGADQIDSVAHQLNSVFVLIEQLRAVPTQSVTPMTHPHDMQLRLRDDLVSEIDSRDTYQAGAPSTQDGLYLVPRVLE
jgi:aspartyl-tRNA(Asn)/glutamyl-tRNA(Gln) amidotransferase subunit C